MALCFDPPTMREPSRRALLAGAGASLVGLGSTPTLSSEVADAPVDATAAATTAAATVQSPGDDAVDWPMPRYDPPCTGHAPDASGPADDVRVAWRTEIGSLSGAIGAPIALGDAIYVTGGGLLAIDADDGERRFARRGPYETPPVRAKSDVYRTDALAVAGPGAIYGLNEDGGIDVPVLDAAIGSQRWSTESSGSSPGAVSFGNPPYDPVAAGNSVYAPLPDSERLVALDADDGSVRWSASPGPEHHGGVRRPAVRSGTVYAVTGYPGTATAYDARDGTQLWERSVGEGHVLSPVATDAGMLVPRETGLTLLDSGSGSVTWERELDGEFEHGSAAVADGTAFVAADHGSGGTYALDLATGEERWTADGVAGTAPVVADGVVYLGDGHQIRALDAETGDERFAWAGEFQPNQPIVARGRLYTVDLGNLVALEEA